MDKWGLTQQLLRGTINMFEFLSHLPVVVSTFFIVIPAVVIGIFATIGITESKARERTKARQTESDELQEKIKKLYQEESRAQDEKIQEQDKQLKDLNERLVTIEAENKLMKRLLNGTDDKSLAYRAKVETTLKLVDELAQVIILNGKKTDKIMLGVQMVNKNIEKLARAIEKKPSK